MHAAKLIARVLIVVAWITAPAAALAQVGQVVVGMDLPAADRFSADEQDKMLQAVHAAGVRVIRTWIGNNSSYEFVRKAFALGIKADLTIQIQYPPDAVRRAAVQDMPDMFTVRALSAANPELTETVFEAQLKRLEGMGLDFVAFEVGNELNNPSFNGEFQIHPKNDTRVCKNMSLEDLKNDPEGRTIAAGLRNYVKVLAAVKQVRDHSTLNRHTPVILGGLADQGAEAVWPGARANGVSIRAAIEYMREFGLDEVVDAYGIHTYPWDNRPGQPGPAANRRKRLEEFALSECRPENRGKPCWITEWGFRNSDESCPANDKARATLVREMMADFCPYVQQKRLLGLLYYVWQRDAWARHEDPFSVFRCGSLTESGQLAIDANLLR
jgi:hypothetical protein